jgi:hypothetical protein
LVNLPSKCKQRAIGPLLLNRGRAGRGSGDRIKSALIDGQRDKPAGLIAHDLEQHSLAAGLFCVFTALVTSSADFTSVELTETITSPA